MNKVSKYSLMLIVPIFFCALAYNTCQLFQKPKLKEKHFQADKDSTSEIEAYRAIAVYNYTIFVLSNAITQFILSINNRKKI